MAEVPRVGRVKRSDLEVGTQVERAEHPWASKKTAERIACDHLEEDSSAYSQGKGGNSGRTVVILNQNVKAVPAHKRKPSARVPKQTAPAWQTWGQELL